MRPGSAELTSHCCCLQRYTCELLLVVAVLEKLPARALYAESGGVCWHSLALCPRCLQVAQTCLNLHHGKEQRPRFHEMQIRSNVSWRAGRRIGPATDWVECPPSGYDCAVDIELGCGWSTCMAHASATWSGSWHRPQTLPGPARYDRTVDACKLGFSSCQTVDGLSAACWRKMRSYSIHPGPL